ncbi:MAG: hypothetical protein KF819_09815 [Labilithrix sp.]|nr:hypothetical protein [Labilithrix sp.]
MRVLSSVVLVALVSAWTRDARADCKSDAECKGDRICEKGTCVSPPPPAAMPPAAPPPAAPPPPPAAPPAAVAAPAVDAVSVSIDGIVGDHVRLDGPTDLDCRVPCRVTITPGRYTLFAKGFEQEVDIPYNQASRIEMNRACSVCVILGGILAGGGLPFMIGGAALMGGAERTANIGSTIYTYTDDDEHTPGVALLVNGILMTTSGVALLIAGLAKGPQAATVNGETASAPGNKREATRFALEPQGLRIRF